MSEVNKKSADTSEENNGDFKNISEKGLPVRLIKLFEKAEFSDITFVLRDEFNTDPVEIHVYKGILSVGSPVFKKMFNENWSKEKKIEIEMDFATIDSFKEMLRHLYSDNVTLTNENTSEILYLAKKYLITILEDKCLQYLKSNISVDNCLQVYEKTLFDDDIGKFCIDYIKKYAYKIIPTQNFCNIQKQTLQTILKCDDLYVEEIELFKGVHKWILKSCEEMNLAQNTQNKRKMIEDLIYLIRFPLMTFSEFSECIKLDSTILPPDDIIDLVKYFGQNDCTNLAFNNCERNSISADKFKVCVIANTNNQNAGSTYCQYCGQYTIIGAKTIFSVNADIILDSISLNNTDTNFSVVIIYGDVVQKNVITTGNHIIKLSEKIKIKKHQTYEIKICILGTKGSIKCQNTASNVPCGSITFNTTSIGGIYSFYYIENEL